MVGLRGKELAQDGIGGRSDLGSGGGVGGSGGGEGLSEGGLKGLADEGAWSEHVCGGDEMCADRVDGGRRQGRSRLERRTRLRVCF
jgi:hypothetical protein